MGEGDMRATEASRLEWESARRREEKREAAEEEPDRGAYPPESDEVREAGERKR